MTPLKTMDKKKATITHRRRRETIGDAIRVDRRLDADTAKRFMRSMTKLVDSGLRECIIDMSQTEAVDSSGSGSLVAAARKMSDVGGAVAIVCTNATVRRLFEIAGITRLVPVFSRIEEARAVVASASSAALAS
jgi:anti-sigma B factor antagonist